MYMEKVTLWRTASGETFATPELAIFSVENSIQIYIDSVINKALKNSSHYLHHADRVAIVKEFADNIETITKHLGELNSMIYGNGRHIDEHIEE